MSPLTGKSRISDAVHQTFLGLGGLVLLAMALIIIAGVVARYLFNSPIPGVTELIGEGLMVAVIYLALSSAHHIRVSLIVNRLPDRVKKYTEYFVVGLCAAVLLLGVIPSVQQTMSSYQSGEATTGLMTFDIWPYRALIVVGIFLTAVRAIERGRRWLEADESGMRGETAPGPDLADGVPDPKQDM